VPHNRVRRCWWVDVVTVEIDNMDSRVRGNDETEAGMTKDGGITKKAGMMKNAGVTTSGIRLYCSYCATVNAISTGT
jgi:hypothetical protein